MMPLESDFAAKLCEEEISLKILAASSVFLLPSWVRDAQQPKSVCATRLTTFTCMRVLNRRSSKGQAMF